MAEPELALPQVIIPTVEEDSVTIIPEGRLGKEIEKKFEKIDQVLFGIMIAVILSMIAIIVSVIGLFLDQMRYNNAAYRDYSQKLDVGESKESVNKQAIQQNKEYQELILKQQEILLELLGPKD